jgi:transposase
MPPSRPIPSAQPTPVVTDAGRVFRSQQTAGAQLSTHDTGAYLLRSNIADWTDRQLWKAYIQLTQAEAAFRIQKDQLTVRPIWHQREDRVQAHILVCFLAFVLWKCPEIWQAAWVWVTRRAPS